MCLFSQISEDYSIKKRVYLIEIFFFSFLNIISEQRYMHPIRYEYEQTKLKNDKI